MYKAFAVLTLLALIIIVFIGIPVGWVKNAYEITKLDFEPPYKAEIIRSGAFIAFPLAGVVGWMNIPDGDEKK